MLLRAVVVVAAAAPRLHYSAERKMAKPVNSEFAALTNLQNFMIFMKLKMKTRKRTITRTRTRTKQRVGRRGAAREFPVAILMKMMKMMKIAVIMTHLVTRILKREDPASGKQPKKLFVN